MKRILIASLVTLAACAASPRNIPGHVTYMPDGSPVYAITCDGPFSDESDCITRAGQICEETGYTIVNNDHELLSLKRSMTIRCKTDSGLYPADDKNPPR